jgi:hypothetical protein
MTNDEVAKQLTDEMKAFPVFTQTVVAGALETIKKEIGEGKIILADMFATEERFIGVLSAIIDLETNTGIVDPIDRPLIEKVVKVVIVGALKKAFGDDWLSRIQSVIA